MLLCYNWTVLLLLALAVIIDEVVNALVAVVFCVVVLHLGCVVIITDICFVSAVY